MSSLGRVLLLSFVVVQASACRPRMAREGSDVLAEPQARKIIGPAQPWQKLSLNAAELDASVEKRRRVGWDITKKVLEPTVIYDPETAEPYVDAQGRPMTVPLWQTWYEMSEFDEMFGEFYWRRLSKEQRDAGAAPDELIDDVMATHHQKPLMSRWAKKLPSGMTKFETLLSQVGDPTHLAALNGVSGKGFTGFSPAMVRHYLKHWKEVIDCKKTDPDFTTGNTDKDTALCYGQVPFPPEAVAIKATWNPLDLGVGIFDTTAKGITTTLTNKTWRTKPGQAPKPGPAEIYTSPTFNDEKLAASFRLTGLHVTTKDTPHWTWVTLWWAQDPDSDFGADRPSDITGVWRNYKMCVVSGFEEKDEEFKKQAAKLATDGFKDDDKSLAGAMAASYAKSQPNPWCSNPFIETRPNVANTNCIACHQHAGPGQGALQMKPELERKRKSFMADFTWSYDSFTEGFRSSIERIMGDEPPSEEIQR